MWRLKLAIGIHIYFKIVCCVTLVINALIVWTPSILSSKRKDDFAQWCKTHRADDADVVIHFFESAADFTRNQDKLPDWISQVKKILRRAT